MRDAELDRLFTGLDERAGLPRPTEDEVAAALDLARVVARGIVRRGAPLACYAAGLAMGATMDPAERAERLAALVGEVEAMAAETAAADGAAGAPDAPGHRGPSSTDPEGRRA